MTNGQPPTKASPPIPTIVGGVQTVQVAGTDANASYLVGQRHTADMFIGPASKAFGSFFVPALVGVALIIFDRVRRRRRAV